MEEMEKQELENQEISAEEMPAEEAPKYVPRPMWQVWLARIGLVLFIALIVMYYIHMFRGGR